MSSASEPMSLDDQLRELVSLFEKGLNHQNEELYQIASSRPEDHFYVHMISSLFRGIEGVLSMDKEILEDALSRLKKAAAGCSKYRKKSGWFFRSDYNSYSDGKLYNELFHQLTSLSMSPVETHAELAHADVMMFTAICTILHQEMSLLSFINAAINVKSAYSSYQTCYAIINNKTNWDSDLARMDLESGTRMAIGAFDLMISFIPNKFAKLLEYVGFSGDRQFGLHELMMSESLPEGSRWPVTACILCTYNLFLEVAYGLAEPDLKLVRDIAYKMQKKFPDVSLLYFLYLSVCFGTPCLRYEASNKTAADDSVIDSSHNSLFIFIS